jgi:acetolactate synthase-1/3 small subunit
MPNSIVESLPPHTDQALIGANNGGTTTAPATGKCHVIRDTMAGGAKCSTVIELMVRNHAGAMSHITGLFARRAFNLEAIACAPIGDGSTSRMLLLVGNDARLEQVERQLAKLYDVLSVRHREDIGPEVFARMVA